MRKLVTILAAVAAIAAIAAAAVAWGIMNALFVVGIIVVVGLVLFMPGPGVSAPWGTQHGGSWTKRTFSRHGFYDPARDE